jgi:hypothetical protein
VPSPDAVLARAADALHGLHAVLCGHAAELLVLERHRAFLHHVLLPAHAWLVRHGTGTHAPAQGREAERAVQAHAAATAELLAKVRARGVGGRWGDAGAGQQVRSSTCRCTDRGSHPGPASHSLAR